MSIYSCSRHIANEMLKASAIFKATETIFLIFCLVLGPCSMWVCLRVPLQAFCLLLQFTYSYEWFFSKSIAGRRQNFSAALSSGSWSIIFSVCPRMCRFIPNKLLSNLLTSVHIWVLRQPLPPTVSGVLMCWKLYNVQLGTKAPTEKPKYRMYSSVHLCSVSWNYCWLANKSWCFVRRHSTRLLLAVRDALSKIDR